MTREEWIAEATRRFGPDPLHWKFRCPVCGFVASSADWKAAGAPVEAVGVSCVGRWTGGKGTLHQPKPQQPCDYAGYGLFRLNPVRVEHEGEIHELFEFAEAT